MKDSISHISHKKLQLATQLFEGDELSAKQWLKTPSKALGGSAPSECSDEDVMELVGRIEHGIVS